MQKILNEFTMIAMKEANSNKKSAVDKEVEKMEITFEILRVLSFNTEKN